MVLKTIIRYVCTIEIDCENINENTDTEESEPKFEFKYDVDTCFTNDFPEMEVQDQPISVAPGEGKIPVNILDDEEWDQKTHPFLDPTGDNNLHKQRRVKITPQQFFEQRLFNAETIYGETSSFMFAAVSYVEKKQINNNINICFQRGQKSNSGGKTQYSLKDPFSVLDGMKNTPRYLQKKK